MVLKDDASRLFVCPDSREAVRECCFDAIINNGLSRLSLNRIVDSEPEGAIVKGRALVCQLMGGCCAARNKLAAIDAPLGIDRFGHRSRTRGQPQRGVRGNWQLAFHEVLLASEVVAARSMGETAHRAGRLNSQLPTMVRSRSFVLCCLVLGRVPGLAVRGHDGDTRGHQVASNQQRAHC